MVEVESLGFHARITYLATKAGKWLIIQHVRHNIANYKDNIYTSREERNIVRTIKRRKANWSNIVYELPLEHVNKGKREGMIK